ncbi:hypothetical protein ACFFQF_22785 [Haladaptatus pallidirubidus]|uniref:Uncharacterized protein n=2 Tax=Haladaptatus pallidirubidus TaxID=1008152 RepID=A0AAV3UNV4_9EURY|nr:hypothetical protein [Haladaptatus pallidirubidus]
MYFLFSAFLGGNFTMIPVVLSINQLVLSRELSAPGELRRRIEDALEYREDAQERADQSVAPVLPGSFLRFLHETTEARTEELRESVANNTDDRLQERVETFADNVLTDVKTVLRTLDTEPVQIFAVIKVTLGTNHAQQLREINRIEVEFDEYLTDDQRNLFGEIRTNFIQIDVARKYFRTVYVKKELSHLSRIILYVGVPAELLSAVVLVVYGGVKTTPLVAGWLDVLVPIVLTAGFRPFAVLFSFVLRLSLVAQHNASVAPFTASDEEHQF